MRWVMWMWCAGCAGAVPTPDAPKDTGRDQGDDTDVAETAPPDDTDPPADDTDPPTDDTDPDPPGPVDTDAGDDTDTPAPPDPDPLTAADLVEGDLLVMEFLADADDCSDGESEYVEVFHPGPGVVDLAGLELHDSERDWAFPAGAQIGPGERILLVRDPGNTPQCYGLTGLLYDGDLGLDADGDELRLVGPTGVEIERVDFSDWDIDAGVAWERDESDPSTWCHADRRILGATDLGSPGVPNGDCFP
jgi:hypothetical protein